jgi:hypothetical protein
MRRIGEHGTARETEEQATVTLFSPWFSSVIPVKAEKWLRVSADSLGSQEPTGRV